MTDSSPTPNDNDSDDLAVSAPKNPEMMVGDVPKKSFFKNKKTIGIFLIILSILALSYVGFLNYYKTSEKQGFKDIVIGDSTITQDDISRYATSVDKYKKQNPQVILKQSSEEIALDDLVMNAALKKEAKDRNKSLTDTEYRKTFNIDATTTGYKENLETVKDGDTVAYYELITKENSAIILKIDKDLISDRSIFFTAINFDSPYFRNEKDHNKLATYHKQAIDRLNKDYLPLYQQKKSPDSITKKADVDLVNGTALGSKLFTTTSASYSDYYEHYSDDPDTDQGRYQSHDILKEGSSTNFRDIENVEYGYPVKDLRNTVDEINKLQKEGDHTEVFASKSGNYMIARLEKKSGGIYQSWQDFVNNYKEQYVPKNDKTSALNNIKTNLGGKTVATINRLSNIGTQTAYAKHDATGCSGHNITAQIKAYDDTTSYPNLVAVSVGNATISQSTGSCGTGNSSSGTGFASIGANCWAPESSLSSSLSLSTAETNAGYTKGSAIKEPWNQTINNHAFWQKWIPIHLPNTTTVYGNSSLVRSTDGTRFSSAATISAHTIAYGWANKSNQDSYISDTYSGVAKDIDHQICATAPATISAGAGTWTRRDTNGQKCRTTRNGGTVSVTFEYDPPGGGGEGGTNPPPPPPVVPPPPPPVVPPPPTPEGLNYVLNFPYFRSYGNDVTVGSFFRNDRDECPTGGSFGSPSIVGFTHTIYEPDGHGLNNHIEAGSSAQFAVFLGAGGWTGELVDRASGWGNGIGIFSDNQRPISPPNVGPDYIRAGYGRPNSLTFGNARPRSGNVQPPAVRDNDWGGPSGIPECVPNYFKDAKDAGATISSGGKLGDVAPTLVAPIDDGVRKLLVVEGDLFINHNIEYKNTSWDSVSDIPNVTVVVKGNIRIDKDVTRLDGIYVAQPKSQGTDYGIPNEMHYGGNNPVNGGLIYTCAREDGPYPNAGNPEPCQKQLVVNGSFISRKIYFHRTYGSTTCAPQNPLPCEEADPYESATTQNNAAEVFNFSPEAYLTPLNSKLETSAPYQKYDYITSLPPVL